MSDKPNKWGEGLKEIKDNPKLKASWKASVAKGNLPAKKKSMAMKMKDKKELVGSLKGIRAKFK